MKHLPTSASLLAFSAAVAYLAQAEDPLLSYKAEIIAKAQPDECFYNLYDPDAEDPTITGNNVYIKEGIDCDACIANNGLPKINQSYVWGMVRKQNENTDTNNYLWFGTGPNVNRLVSGVYYGASRSSITSSSSRGITFSTAEYGNSRFAREGIYGYDSIDDVSPTEWDPNPVDPAIGDWRPPDAFRLNLETEQLENLYDNMDGAEQAMLWKTLGLRSAGYTAPTPMYADGIVFLAGPSITATSDGGDGVIMFAFDAITGDCIGAQSFPTYTNIRKWKHYNGQLYTAIATDTGTGEVLRWTGDDNNVFQFEVVGTLDAGGAEVEVHDDGDGPRLYVNTWPGIEGNLDLEGDLTTIQNLINAPAGLWRSPIIPTGGLTSSNSGQWSLVWSVVDYEPDLVLALHYGGGAMASFDGWLYWGTMHVPGTAGLAHAIGYGSPQELVPEPDPYPEDPNDPDRLAYEADQERIEDERDEDGENTYRSISIWRGRGDFNKNNGNIELLYGRQMLPVRMERLQFTRNRNNPRDNFDTFYLAFMSQNIGNLRNVPDRQVSFTGGETGFFLRDIEGGDWDITPNTSGFIPRHGSESIEDTAFPFGSFTFYFPTNNYTWTMQVFDGKLYVGTMDFSGIGRPDQNDGADLFCFPAGDTTGNPKPATRISSLGMANWSSYGIRTIAADDNRGELYLGMANVENLLSTKVGDPRNGGWEIQRVIKRFPDDDFDELDDDWETLNFGSTSSAASTSSNADGDPLSDLEEWLAGTNPNDPNSFFFKVIEDSTSEGMQQIEWPSIPGRYYTVCETEDLNGVWAPVTTYEGDPDSDPLIYEFDPTLTDAKFFKVVITLDAPE